MADVSKIEWTDATWQIITGCSVTSPGCKRCYAMRLAGTRLQHHPSRAGLTIMSAAGPVWTGEVRFNEQWLDQPLQWTKPRMIFVCAHADLFHESVPDAWIDRVFDVMARATWHTFQVLTKRSARMRVYMAGRTVRRLPVLAHIWLGVSAEDQRHADLRIPDLLATAAAVRWVSLEPLLGAICLTELQPPGAERIWVDALHGDAVAMAGVGPLWKFSALSWVVMGGESGPGARPANPQWFRDIRDQCAVAGTPLLHKQNGSWVSVSEVAGPGVHRTFDDGRTVRRVGKKLAGRLLDGVEHNSFPEVRHG